MAFPTIPTAAANKLLSSLTTPASTTHTFPSLTTLAPAAGDLIIAICVQYSGGTGGSAGDQFSSWGAGFSAKADLETTTNLDIAVGIATKTATGSESGTFTVTSANSFKSVNFLMLIPAGEWQAVEVSAATRATNAVPDPASFNPAGWDAEDTLWIALGGHSETSTTGSPPVITTAPTNFTGELIVARAADAVGDITAAVAFRQQNASAQDVGTWTVSNATRGNGIAVVIAVQPAAITNETPTPGGALAGGAAPSPRTTAAPGGALADGSSPTTQVSAPHELRGTASRSNTFESGAADGTAITVANSDDASAGDAFSAVTGGPTYSEVNPKSGALSMLVDTTATYVEKHPDWTSLGAFTTSVYARFYVYLDDYPVAQSLRLAQMRTASGGSAHLFLLPSGALQTGNAAQSAVGSPSSPLPKKRWIRIEWRVLSSTTAGESEWWVYLDPEAPLGAHDYHDNATGLVLGASSDGLRVGASTAVGPNSMVLKIDDVAFSSTSQIGPSQTGNGRADGNEPSAVQIAVAQGGALAGGFGPTESGGGEEETPIPGGATAGGTTPTSSASQTISGATAGGNAPAADTSLASGGALAGGFDSSAEAQLGQGGAGADGTTPTTAASLVAGGAVAGGFEPTEDIGGTSETPTPGGALADGVAPIALVLAEAGGASAAGALAGDTTAQVTAGGALAGGFDSAAEAQLGQGGVTADGTTPTTAASLTAGGALAGGFAPGENVAGGDLVPAGGALAGGTSPTASVSGTTGGAVGAGVSATVTVPLTISGALAGGNEPSAPIFETPTPGGADVGGFSPGTSSTVTQGGAVVSGLSAAAFVNLTIGGATARGNAPTEIGVTPPGPGTALGGDRLAFSARGGDARRAGALGGDRASQYATGGDRRS